MTQQQSSPSGGGRVSVLAASLLLVASGIAAAQGNSPSQLRRFIDEQVGGIHNSYQAAAPLGKDAFRPALKGALPLGNNCATEYGRR